MRTTTWSSSYRRCSWQLHSHSFIRVIQLKRCCSAIRYLFNFIDTSRVWMSRSASRAMHQTKVLCNASIHHNSLINTRQERGMCLPTSTDAATASSYRLVAPYTAGITSPADCVRDCHYVDGCSAINWYPETSSCELLQLPTSYSFYSKAVWQKGCFFAYRVIPPMFRLGCYLM